MNKNEFTEKVIVIILIIIVLFFYSIGYYNTNFVAIMLMVIEIYTMIKYRKNPFLLFIFVCMFYFDYSFIISKYIMNTPNLENVYSQIKYQNTLYIGISSVFIFHACKLVILKKKNCNENILYQKLFKNTNDKKNNLVVIILTIGIAIILLDYLFFDFLSLSRTIYEYLLILFVLAFYYAKDNKFFRRILFVLMMISTIVNMIRGRKSYFITTYDSIFFYKLL